MNATKWDTLTNFVMYLGKTGKAVVDQVDGKGLYVFLFASCTNAQLIPPLR